MSKRKQYARHLKEKREDAAIPSITVISTYDKAVIIASPPKRKNKNTPKEPELSSSDKLPTKQPPPQSLVNSSPNSLLNQLENKISTVGTPEKKAVRLRLQKLLKQTPSTPTTIASPAARTATEKFTRTIEQVTTPTREEMFFSVKQSVRKKQKFQFQPPKDSSPDDPVDPHAFRNYHPTKKGADKERPSASVESNESTKQHKWVVNKAAYLAERRAVKKNRIAILSAGDPDQITLALKGVLNDPAIRPYYQRLVGERLSDASKVRAEAVIGMKKIVGMVAASRDNGGRSKQCRSLLQTIVMTMLNKDAASGTKRAIRREILGALSNGTAWRLLTRAGEKRKKFEQEDIREYRAVEIEEERMKYPDDEINDLQEYMCNNLHTRNSPNTEDTLRKRDRNGNVSSILVLLVDHYCCTDLSFIPSFA